MHECNTQGMEANHCDAFQPYSRVLLGSNVQGEMG